MMDREQFTSAVLAAEPTLYRVAKTMLRSEHDCADAAQQAILRAWEQLDSLRSTRYFKTWLVRILINECSTILRRQQRLAPYDAAAVEAIPAGPQSAGQPARARKQAGPPCLSKENRLRRTGCRAVHRRNRICRECTELVSAAVSEWRRRESRRVCADGGQRQVDRRERALPSVGGVRAV